MSDDDAVGLSDPALNQPVDLNYQPKRVLGVFAPETLNLFCSAHLLGKWRLLLPQLDAYFQSHRFLGHTDGRTYEPRMALLTQANPARFLSLIEEMKLTNLRPGQNIIIEQSHFDHGRIESIQQGWERCTNKPTLLFVDTIPNYLPNGKINEFADVRDFCLELNQWAHDKVTIVGTTFSAKQRAGQGYDRTLDQIIGSANWPKHAGTCAFLELPPSSDESSPMRRLRIGSGTSAWSESYWEFDAFGRLVPSLPSYQWDTKLDHKLDAKPVGEPFRAAEIVSWCAEEAVPPTTMKRWISRQLSDGRMQRIRKGMYIRPQVC